MLYQIYLASFNWFIIIRYFDQNVFVNFKLLVLLENEYYTLVTYGKIKVSYTNVYMTKIDLPNIIVVFKNI